MRTTIVILVGIALLMVALVARWELVPGGEGVVYRLDRWTGRVWVVIPKHMREVFELP